MKTLSVLSVAALALVVSVSVASAQSDPTTTILQGLQNWNGGTATTPKSATGFDSMKSSALAKASLAAIDTDRSGTVSKEELAAMTNKLFLVADTDGNGQLTEAELSSFANNMNTVLTYLR